MGKTMSDQRTKRLKNDHERLVVGLAGNSFVKVVEAIGDPRSQYIIAYNLKGVTVDASAGKLSYATHHEVEITLFKEYPTSPPYCKAKTEIFHPNISSSEIWIGDENTWSPSTSLLDVVKHIARMISCQDYDLSSPLNEKAAKWAKKNESAFPLDPRDFFAQDLSQPEVRPKLEHGAQAEAFCAYCLEPNPRNTCDNGHPACDDCLTTCKHCDNTVCLACADQICSEGKQKVETYIAEIASALDQGNIDEAEAIGSNALEEFPGISRLTESLDKVAEIKRTVDHVKSYRKSKYFHGIITACEELRSLGFENEALAEAEQEASDRLGTADSFVDQGKKELDVNHDPQSAGKHFSDALEIVPDHPSAYKLLKQATARTDKAKKHIESAQRLYDSGQYHLAVVSAKKAGSLDATLSSKAQELIDAAGHVESSQEGKRKRRIAALLATGGALILAAVIFFYVLEHRRLKAEYNLFLQDLESVATEEAKAEILNAYIISHDTNRYTKDAQKQLERLRAVIDERQFEMAKRNASIMLTEKDYEKAEAIYKQYLSQNPDTIYATELNKSISEIRGLADEKDYETLLWLSNCNLRTRVGAYRSYLDQHPEGKHREEVNKLIQKTSGEYYEDFKKNVAVLKSNQDWDECIQTCDEFEKNLGKSQWADEVEALRTECRRTRDEEKDLADLIAKAEAKGQNYEAAKQVYLKYLKENPNSYVSTEITNRVNILDQKMHREKEWAKIQAHVASEKEDLGKRISTLEKYVAQNPSGEHLQEATQKLKELQEKRDVVLWKQVVDTCRDSKTTVERKVALVEDFVKQNTSGKHLSDAKAKLGELEHEQMNVAWTRIASYCDDQSISMPDRINKLTKYINQNPSGQFIQDAQRALHKLKRFQREEEEIRRLISKTGNTYVYRNGIITDKRTGLMWCAFDSYLDLQYCLKYKSAMQYVKQINYGGYTDWRLPSEAALRVIYKNKPFFPTATDGEWYWTSNQASGRMVPVVMSDREIGSGMARIETDIGCGSVRAVRGP
jgi:ubiquitin-protein ligase